MHEIEKALRRHAVQFHQAGQCRAVVAVILLLQAMRFVGFDLEKIADEGAHFHVDLGKQIAGR